MLESAKTAIGAYYIFAAVAVLLFAVAIVFLGAWCFLVVRKLSAILEHLAAEKDREHEEGQLVAQVTILTIRLRALRHRLENALRRIP